MKEMLKQDHYLLGVGIGILSPLLLFLLIYGINYVLLAMDVVNGYMDQQSQALVSIFGNLLAIRYYFVSLKFDKTGRGVLLVTFLVILIIFAFEEQLFSN